jgi:hypothetical protein
MANLKIIESEREIDSKIKKALVGEVNKSLIFSARLIKKNLTPILYQAILISPEMSSLRGGTLKGEFGLTYDPTTQIAKAVVDSLEIDVRKADQNLANGGLLLTMQPSFFNNLLSLPVAEQVIEDGSLPWLKWLLTLGDKIIITEYGVEFGNFQNSRSGFAVMKKEKAPYKVNSAFSGTVENNFITRSIARVGNQIEDEIERVLKNGR